MTHAQHAPPHVSADGEIRPVASAPARERWSWALYDFANTIFSMNVATLFFIVWMGDDLRVPNTPLAIASSISSLLVALSIPIFGAISDAHQRRKAWVVGFTLIAIVATLCIGVMGHLLVPLTGEQVVNGVTMESEWRLQGGALFAILVTFVIANYAYQGALPFYNAMLPELAPPSEHGRLSGLGTALGYVGSITGVLAGMLFFAGGIPGVISLPEGVTDALRGLVPFTGSGGRVATFVPTALLFLLFSLPLFLFCRDHNPRRNRTPVAWREAFADVVRTVRETERYPGALRFILASFLYQDAMGTLITFMALYAVKAVGFDEGMDATVFLALTVPAVLGSFICGFLVDKIGPKRSLMFVLGAWIVLLLAMIWAPSRLAFWVVGVGIGLVFGGIATAERPMLLTLVPDVEAGRFFGLMVLSARAAAIVGPLIWAFTVDGFTPSLGEGVAYRMAVGTVTLAMGLALLLLRTVPDKSPHGLARARRAS